MLAQNIDTCCNCWVDCRFIVTTTVYRIIDICCCHHPTVLFREANCLFNEKTELYFILYHLSKERETSFEGSAFRLRIEVYRAKCENFDHSLFVKIILTSCGKIGRVCCYSFFLLFAAETKAARAVQGWPNTNTIATQDSNADGDEMIGKRIKPTYNDSKTCKNTTT